jgi:RHS repeat-associated protein
MNPTIAQKRNRSPYKRWPLIALAFTAGLMLAFHAPAIPRPPYPYLPSRAPELVHLHWDDQYSFRETNTQITLGQYNLVESWSGFALDRSGQLVVPWPIPGVDALGHTNLPNTATAAISARFWLAPYWSSASVTNGTGPGLTTVLLEMNAVSAGQAVRIWSLQVSADGSALSLIADSDNGPTALLSAPIVFEAGTAHLVHVSWSDELTALYVDGQLAAQGNGTVPVPPTLAELTLGSARDGTSPAQGAIDEFFLLGAIRHDSLILRSLDEGDYFIGTLNVAALGPITDAEANALTHRPRAMVRPMILVKPGGSGSGPGPGDLVSSNCITGGPVYLTNIVALTNLGAGFPGVQFSVAGGTNATNYSLYRSANAGAPFLSTNWVWTQYAQTCDIITVTNPPTPIFYLLGPEKDSLGNGFPDSWSVLHGFDPTHFQANLDPDHDGLNNFYEYTYHTDPNNPDTDYDGVPDGQEVLDGTIPTDPNSVSPVLLGNWRFDTPDWVGLQGQLPISTNHLALVAGLSQNAVSVNSTNAAWLTYADTNANTLYGNINLRQGSLKVWFKPAWNSTTTNSGTGPQSEARLLEVGTKGSTMFWGLTLDTNGTTLSFKTPSGTNGTGLTNNLSATVRWTSNDWHQICLTWTPNVSNGSALYIDGQSVTNGTGVSFWPDSSVRAQGFRLGSDSAGTNQAKGRFDNLQTYNYALSADEVRTNYHTPCPYPADIVFLLDHCTFVRTSNNIGLAKLACTNVLNVMGNPYDQAALITFDTVVSNYDNLTGSLTSILIDLTNIPTPADNLKCYMTNALLAAQAELVSPRHRTGAVPMIFLMSEGHVDDSPTNDIISVANAIKAAGTRIAVLALGLDPNSNLLAVLPSSPSDYYWASATNTVALSNVPNSYFSAVSCPSNLPPSVTITSPTNYQAFTMPATVNITATAGDPEEGLVRVEFYGGTTLLASDKYSPFTAVWTGPPAGTNTIKAIAYDEFGLTATSKVDIVVASPTSVIQILSPTNGQLLAFSPTNIPVTILASEAGGSITNVSLSVSSVFLGSNNGVYQFLWTNVSAGSYTVGATATDFLNHSVSTNVPVRVWPLPVITNTTPTNSVSPSATVALSAWAWASTNFSVRFYLFTNYLGTGSTTDNTNFTLSFSTNRPGHYPITAVVSNGFGAQVASLIRVFTVTNTTTAPTVWIAYPTNGSVFPAGVDLTLTASNINGSGTVTNVEFFANHLSLGSDPATPWRVQASSWKPGTYDLIARATDTLGITAVSTQATITVVQGMPVGPSYWDPNFFLPLVDQCSNVDLEAVQIVSSAVSGSTFYCATVDEEDDPQGPGPSIWKWDGTNWFRWGLGLCTNSPFLIVAQIALDGSQLYAVDSYYGVGRFDGTNWTNLGGPVSTPSLDQRGNGFPNVTPRLRFFKGDLYLYGNFIGVYTNGVADTNIQYLARWSPATSNWTAAGSQLNGPVLAMADFDGRLFIGGMFTNAAGNPNANHIAELVNGDWANVGTGMKGTNWNYDPVVGGSVECAVFSLAAWGTNLIAGGDFVIAGSATNANGVALWNGHDWQAIGQGLRTDYDSDNNLYSTVNDFYNPIVYCLAVRGSEIFVGGSFAEAINPSGESVSVANIAEAKWDEASQTWSWLDLDYGLFQNVSSFWQPSVPQGEVATLSIAEGPSPGAYDLYAGGRFFAAGANRYRRSDYPGDTLIYNLLARWRVGYTNSSASPYATLTNPSPNTFFASPLSSLQLEGHAQAGSNNVTSVEVTANGQPIGNATFSPSTAAADFSFASTTTLDPGPYLLKAIATDVDGRKGESAPVLITVKGTNYLATNDFYSIPQGNPTVALKVLTNDAPGLRISQVTQFHQDLGHAALGHDGSYLWYTPSSNRFGIDRFAYSVTNSAGQSDFAWVTVTLLAKPVVAFGHPLDGNVFGTNDNVALSGIARDFDGSVTNLDIFVRGSLYARSNSPTTPSFAFNWSTNTPGWYTFQAVATDNDGLTNSDASLNFHPGRVTIAITNPTTPGNVITALISNLTSTVNDLGVPVLTTVQDGRFHLFGLARDSNTNEPVSYQVLLYRPEDETAASSDDEDPLSQFDGVPIFANVTPVPLDAAGFHPGGDTNTDLGWLDLTAVPNGTYDLVLLVHGGGGKNLASVRFRLESQLKIGQFSFSEQDLVIPVNGVPLTVTRTYNSLNPRTSDFGYSWSYALNAMDIQLDDERREVTIGTDEAPFAEQEEDESGLPNVVSLRTGGGWDVTLTLPDGRRTTFAFGYTGQWPNLYAFWSPPPDVHAKLTMLGNNSIVFGSAGLAVPVWADADMSHGQAPMENQDIRGWTLETPDGTKYDLLPGYTNSIVYQKSPGIYVSARACGPPQLKTIRQLSGDRIAIANNGLQHYSPSNTLTRSVVINRDAVGRITEIYDPVSVSNGLPTVRYVYNRDTGNLIQVHRLQDRTAGIYSTNRYHYDNPNFPHYLTSIEDPRGVPLARNEYDDNGRLIAVVDAQGNRTQFFHSTTNNMEIVVDRLGHTNTHVYDTHGNVTASTNALRQFTLMSYDPNNNNLLSTTDSLGHTTSYSYDDQGNQTMVINALNRTNLSTFANSTLTSTKDPLGNWTTNLLDDFGNVTSSIQFDVTNGIMGQTSSRFANGLMVETRDALGRTNATLSYDGAGNLASSTDANGATRNSAFDGNGNQVMSWQIVNGLGVTNYAAYDAQGRVARSIDAFGKTNQTFYNALGKVDYTIDRLGNTNSFFYDARGNTVQTIGPDHLATKTVFDEEGRPIFVSDRNGITGTRTDYDAAGRVTNSVRLTNMVINVTQVSDGIWASAVASNGVPCSTNSTDYFDNGWVKSRTDPEGHKTSYTYYDDGQTATVTDALTNVTTYAYDAAGRQQYTADALNHTNRFVCDGAGRTVATIFQDSSAISSIINVLGQQAGKADQATNTITYGYNVAGQLERVTMPSVPDPEAPPLGPGGDPSPANPTWHYYFDQYGRQTAMLDAKSRGTTNTFDQFGHQTATRLPLGQTNLLKYDTFGRISETYDFKGQKRLTRYDSLGRVATNFWFAAGASYPSNSTEYYFNALGQLTNITERFGTNASSGGGWAANDSSRRKRYFAALAKLPPEPTGTAAGLALFCVGALAFLCRGLARPLINARALARWPGGPSAAQPFQQFLALARRSIGGQTSRLTVAAASRRPIQLPGLFWRIATYALIVCLIGSDPAWDSLWTARAECVYPANNSDDTVRYTYFNYDFDGHLTQANYPEGVINYEYDLATGRHTRTCSTNTEVAYRYDAMGRLSTVQLIKRNATNLVTPETATYTYTPVGSRATLTNANGVVAVYLYDSLNRLTNLTHKLGGTNLLASYSYTLHSTGRRIGAIEFLKTEDSSIPWITNTLSWQYDSMYRLTNEISLCSTNTGSYTNAYQYDLVGNRFSKAHVAPTNTGTTTNLVDANDRLLKEVTWNGSTMTESNAYSYDDNGSLTSKARTASGTTTTTNYSYDLKNKLSIVFDGTTTTTFLYNHEGIRVRSTTGGSSTLYLIDGNNHTGYQQILEELTARGAVPNKAYVIGDDVLGQTSATSSWLLHDGHGSTRQLADGVGTVTSRYNFDSYGQTLGNSTSPAATSLLYCGEQLDSNLGMYNLRARFYDPASGRFNLRDSFEGSNFDPQSLHRYTYAADNPANLSDPTGQYSLGELLVVGFVYALLIGATAYYFYATMHSVRNLVEGSLPTPDQERKLKAARNFILSHSSASPASVQSFIGMAVTVEVRAKKNLSDNAGKPLWGKTYPLGQYAGPTIFLDNETLLLDERLVAAVLIHESVHVYQWVNKVGERGEKDAYQVESDALRAWGCEAESFTKLRAIFGDHADDFLDDQISSFQDYNITNPVWRR